MGRIGCVRCEKSRRDFLVRTFALITQVHLVLHRVSCSYETIPNAPKHHATHQSMSLGSNEVDWVRSLRKIPTWLRGTNFWLITPVHTVLHWVSCSYETITNAPKHYETYENMSLGSNGVDWVCSLQKKPRRDIVARTFALIAPVYPVLHRVSCSYKKIINAPKHYATQQNMSLGSNGVDWVRSLWKISTWLRGTNFCINCTSSHYFTSSFMQLRNDPKCTQTLHNAPKREFRV